MSDVPTVARERDHALKAIFGRAHGVLIGVVHLLPLPGSPDHRGPEVEPIYERALDDARAYAGCGFRWAHRRKPRRHPVRQARGHRPGDGGAYGGRLRSHPARNRAANRRECARERRATRPRGGERRRARASFGSINGPMLMSPMKDLSRARPHGRPAIAENSRRTASVFSPTRMSSMARTLSCRTGRLPNSCATSNSSAPTPSSLPASAPATLPISIISGPSNPATSLPTLVGSGVTSDNVGDILAVVDGVIVASALKVDGRWWNAVDPERANRFVDRAASLGSDDPGRSHVFRTDALERRRLLGTRRSVIVFSRGCQRHDR